MDHQIGGTFSVSCLGLSEHDTKDGDKKIPVMHLHFAFERVSEGIHISKCVPACMSVYSRGVLILATSLFCKKLFHYLFCNFLKIAMWQVGKWISRWLDEHMLY